jgi:hypothetical protein
VARSIGCTAAGEEAHLALEDRRRGLVTIGPALAELGVGHGVEGAGGDALAHPELPQAGAELARRLAGEGQGEDVTGVGRAGGDPPGDPAGQHPGLARPGAGEDAQWGAVAGDGGRLGLGQPFEEALCCRRHGLPFHANECTEGV